MLRVVRAAYRLGNNHDEAIALTSGNVAIVKHGSIKSLAIVELRLEKGGTYSPATAFPDASQGCYYEKLKKESVWSGRRAAFESPVDQTPLSAQRQNLKSPTPPLETLGAKPSSDQNLPQAAGIVNRDYDANSDSHYGRQP